MDVEQCLESKGKKKDNPRNQGNFNQQKTGKE